MPDNRKAFDLPEWCPDVSVPDVTVVDMCALPDAPEPEASVPPTAEPPMDLIPPSTCQPIHINPFIDVTMVPACMCAGSCSEDFERELLQKRLQKKQQTKLKTKKMFRLEDNQDDCCEGRYQMDLFMDMPCVFEEFPNQIVASASWSDALELPSEENECCQSCTIPAVNLRDKKPKIVIRNIKSTEECQVPDITLDMSIPCPLDSLTDVEFGYDSNGHHVEVFSRKALEEASGPRMTSERTDDYGEECDLREFKLENIVVPAGCYNTEITSRIDIDYASPGSSFSSGVVSGEKTGTKDDRSCEFELDPPTIRIPLPRPCAAMGGSTSLNPEEFKDIFGRTADPFKFSEKIKDQLKVGDGPGPLNEFTLSNIEVMRRSNLAKAVEYALGSHVNVFPDKFRNVLGRGGAVFDSNGNRIDSNGSSGFDECDTAASVDIQLRCPNLPRIVSDSNGQVVRETGKKNRFTVIRGKYLNPADDDSIACTGDVVLHTVQELIPDSAATQSEYGNRLSTSESRSVGIKETIGPESTPTMDVMDDETGEVVEKAVNTDSGDHVFELYKFSDGQYERVAKAGDDLVARRVKNGVPEVVYLRVNEVEVVTDLEIDAENGKIYKKTKTIAALCFADDCDEDKQEIAELVKCDNESGSGGSSGS